MTSYESKEVDGKRYSARRRTDDAGPSEPAYRWEAEDGSTLTMTDEELGLLERRDLMREIDD